MYFTSGYSPKKKKNGIIVAHVDITCTFYDDFKELQHTLKALLNMYAWKLNDIIVQK